MVLLLNVFIPSEHCSHPVRNERCKLVLQGAEIQGCQMIYKNKMIIVKRKVGCFILGDAPSAACLRLGVSSISLWVSMANVAKKKYYKKKNNNIFTSSQFCLYRGNDSLVNLCFCVPD